jgi:hypothetical protein
MQHGKGSPTVGASLPSTRTWLLQSGASVVVAIPDLHFQVPLKSPSSHHHQISIQQQIADDTLKAAVIQ